jgi:hypothetical protein
MAEQPAMMIRDLARRTGVAVKVLRRLTAKPSIRDGCGPQIATVTPRSS